MKNRNGFTLIELLITLAIIGLLAMLVLGRGSCSFFASSEENIAKTKAMMMRYVKFKVPEANSRNTDIMCQNADTDRNGYVRCEAIVRLADDKKEEVQAECPFAISLGRWLGNECTFAKVPIMN